jgi:hypothetical protein
MIAHDLLHGSRRAELPHRALASNGDDHARNVHPRNRLRSVRPAIQPIGKIPEVVLQFLAVDRPCHAVHPWGGVPLEIEVGIPEAIHAVHVVPERPQLHVAISSCYLSYPIERMLQVLPGLCPGPGLLSRIPLGQTPSLHPLRRRRRRCSSAFVRGLPRYTGSVRLPTPVHRRLPHPMSAAPLRTEVPPSASRGISRFPYAVLGRMRGVSDRAEFRRRSRYRSVCCGLRRSPSGSAPRPLSRSALRSGSRLSQLNTRPAPPPVNASPTELPPPAHDSGPNWFATPCSLMTFTFCTAPV